METASRNGSRHAGWALAGRALAGGVLGILTGATAANLGIQQIRPFRTEYVVLYAGLAGLGLALTRARRLGWLLAALVAAGFALVAYTPLIDGAVRARVRRDPLRPVEAAVVLSTGIHGNGGLTSASQRRLLGGYRALRAGQARRLVLSRIRGRPSYLPAVRAQMRLFGFAYPVEEVGPVADTHDEALAVARLARERGWPRVILVTDPIHTSRAAAVFEKAGLPVLCAPADPLVYDPERLDGPSDHLWAFQDWLREAIGEQVYRLHGWL